MVVVVALASSSSSRSLLSSSKVVFQRRRRHHHKNRAHKIDRNSIASVSRSWTSRTSVSVPLRDLDPNEDTNKYSKSSFSEYISDGSRILAVTFPDETRREQMTDTTWKVQVLFVVYGDTINVVSFASSRRRTFGETHMFGRSDCIGKIKLTRCTSLFLSLFRTIVTPRARFAYIYIALAV